MIFKKILFFFIIHKIAICESFIRKNYFELINFGLEQKISVAPSVISDKFSQKVDHFNPTDTRTWKQVYYSEKSYYRRGRPAFLWIEGETKANPNWFEVGYWQAYGKKIGAMLFMVEHRFYGDSQPLKDTTIKHLNYLTTHQALADLATFIKSMNKQNELPEGTKWIVFGGSYAGNLAAWMRMKYPHLVHGAVSSSAPVLAQLDFPGNTGVVGIREYRDVVSNALASYNEQCQNDIANAHFKMDNMIKRKTGRNRIQKVFKLCSPLSENEMDWTYLFNNMANYIANTVQYDRFGKDIKEACDVMLEKATKTNQVRRYSNVMNFLMKKYEADCLSNNFTEFIEYEKQVEPEISGRAWLYQTCTEFGYFQTTNPNNTFSKRLTLDSYVNWCTKIFKTSFNKKFISRGVNKTNEVYGGMKIKATRIVFIHGEIDPWNRLGITKTNRRSNFDSILIRGASHCSDLRLPSDNDSRDVKIARIKVIAILSKWLRDNH